MFYFLPPVSSDNVTMTEKLPSHRVASGTPVQLSCLTDTGNPAPDITWWRNTRQISAADRDSDTAYTITSDTIPGQYNANRTNSTISFLATQATKGRFWCESGGSRSEASYLALKCMYVDMKCVYMVKKCMHGVMNCL